MGLFVIDVVAHTQAPRSGRENPEYAEVYKRVLKHDASTGDLRVRTTKEAGEKIEAALRARYRKIYASRFGFHVGITKRSTGGAMEVFITKIPYSSSDGEETK